jgi:hypothetical protein
MKIVDSDLESPIGQPGAKRSRDLIIAFRDEVKRRAEPQAQLDLGELLNPIESTLAFDIVGEDEGKLLPLRPARPACGWAAGRLIARPDRSARFEDVTREGALGRKPYPARDERLAVIIKPPEQHASFRLRPRPERTSGLY